MLNLINKQMNNILKIWFITDVHGSTICFKKFLNSFQVNKELDVIIIGADISGKYLVPLIKTGKNKWQYFINNKESLITNKIELQSIKEMLENRGLYYLECDEEYLSELRSSQNKFDGILKQLKIERLKQWIELAEQRIIDKNKKVIINCGNDDPYYLDEVLDLSNILIRPEGKMLYLTEEITMISTGLANITPWNCPRDVSENKLESVIDNMTKVVPDFSKCIFNFHCPPYNTSLDKAPKLDKNLKINLSASGTEEVSVGSTAVRNSIEKYQPVVSLHGHIHEKHTYEKIGNTICFNPGSEYFLGFLNGVYLEFYNGLLSKYSLTKEIY